jgi:hypothetical protein
MNDPQLAAALRSRSPDALPELLDAYGDQLFRYCWYLLRNRENAQIAVRKSRWAMRWWSLPRKSAAWFATNGSAWGSIRWPVPDVCGARRFRPQMSASRLPSRTPMTPIRG